MTTNTPRWDTMMAHIASQRKTVESSKDTKPEYGYTAEMMQAHNDMVDNMVIEPVEELSYYPLKED